jgi:glucose/mannose-6-phosphate isomerase
VLDLPGDACESAAATLERVSHLCRPGSDSFVNPGKSLALELAGTLPMIWGTSPLTGVAAYRFACQLSENAKYPGVCGVLPEANHNQVVGFDGPFAPGSGAGPDGGPPVPLRLVLLRDTQEHPQVARRRDESARLAADRGIGVTELAAEGDQPLQRLASLVQLIDYATVYLGIASGIDPGPVAAIQELKARIA